MGYCRRYCYTGYDQSQGRIPSKLKCIGPISMRPQPSRQKLIRNRTASRSKNDDCSRRYVQYRVDQSQTETIIANLSSIVNIGWLVFNDSTRDKDDTAVGVGHSQRYCIAAIPGMTFKTQVHWPNLHRGYRAPTNRQKLIRNRTVSRSKSDGRSRRLACGFPSHSLRSASLCACAMTVM